MEGVGVSLVRLWPQERGSNEGEKLGEKSNMQPNEEQPLLVENGEQSMHSNEDPVFLKINLKRKMIVLKKIALFRLERGQLFAQDHRADK